MRLNENYSDYNDWRWFSEIKQLREEEFCVYYFLPLPSRQAESVIKAVALKNLWWEKTESVWHFAHFLFWVMFDTKGRNWPFVDGCRRRLVRSGGITSDCVINCSSIVTFMNCPVINQFEWVKLLVWQWMISWPSSFKWKYWTLLACPWDVFFNKLHIILYMWGLKYEITAMVDHFCQSRDNVVKLKSSANY